MARTQVRSSTRPHPPADPEREERIRVRAYLLWQADGGPHGRDVEYWEQACELTSAEEAGRLPNSQTAPAQSRHGGIRKTAIKADPAKIPDRPAAQDAIKTNPPPKRAARSKAPKPG
jgi:Protein of unknown function (DUF2934)